MKPVSQIVPAVDWYIESVKSKTELAYERVACFCLTESGRVYPMVPDPGNEGLVVRSDGKLCYCQNENRQYFTRLSSQEYVVVDGPDV